MKPIPGYPGHYACADGHIWSDRSGKLIKRKPRLHSRDKYYRINISIPGNKRQTIYVHRLVLLAYSGEKPHPSLESRHLNGDKHDNRPANLAWGTQEENNLDKELHGTSTRKLTTLAVKMIRASKGKVTQKQLAKAFGVSLDAIQDVLSGKTYKRYL